MRSLLVTGSDTGVGKTWVVATLARLLADAGARVEIVKVVETGVAPGSAGDAARALARAERWAPALNPPLNDASGSAEGRAAQPAQTVAGGADPGVALRDGEVTSELASRAAAAGVSAPGHSQAREPHARISARTLWTFREPLAPAAAAAAEGRTIEWSAILSTVRGLPSDGSGWRIFEGAGGVASPIDGIHDWADFAAEVGVDAVLLVVRDQLGGINQARLCAGHAARGGAPVAIWLNPIAAPPIPVAQSTRDGIHAAGLSLLDANNVLAWLPRSPPAPGPAAVPAATPSILHARLQPELQERAAASLLRKIRVTPPRRAGELELSDNDYLDLAHDPVLIAAGQAALARYGTSAAASPLIAGWKEPHEQLLQSLGRWHGFPCGMLWTSGYAANAAVLATLPRRGDLILADRLIHHSMIAGLTRSGARFKRYPHLDLDRLEAELAEADGVTFVVTESVFSMDGDHPDLARMAALKAQRPFFLILDEAHGVGWYGPEGSGLAAESGAAALAAVDLLVGTLGKTLASGGAYTLFRDAAVRDALVNHAGEFIYSTGLPPANAAVATAAVARVRELAAVGQAAWRTRSREFRAALRSAGWSAPEGDSPIVPIGLARESAALAYAEGLRAEGIHAAAVRPPTVPAGTSRLRLSLKRAFSEEAEGRVLAALGRLREGAA